MGCNASCVQSFDVQETIVVRPNTIMGYPDFNAFPGSRAKFDSKNVTKNQEVIVRTDDKPALRKGVWVNRMTRFLNKHIVQISSYGFNEINRMHVKLQALIEGRGIFDYNLENPKHYNAVKELKSLFSSISDIESMQESILELCQIYFATNRFEDFEHIAFVFAIIVNAPMFDTYMNRTDE